MSLLLRHKPEAGNLMLDRNGWTALDDLVAACIAKGRAGAENDVLRVVEENDKRRFELSPDRTSIRAAQGHTVELDLGLEPVEPPRVLFHGTVERYLDPILRDGLRPMKRTHVHLSSDEETARRVGQRRGDAIILSIAAAALHRAGAEFYRSSNGVWLVDHVPSDYIRVSR